MAKSLPLPAGSTRWARWISNSGTPVFLVDPDRRLALFNQGCTEWTGWTAEEVLSRVCDYVTEPDSHDLAAVLAVCAPPPQAWQGQSVEVRAWLPHRSAPPRQVCIRFLPMLGSDGQVAAVWGEIAMTEALAAAAPTSIALALHAELGALRQSLRHRFGNEALIMKGPEMHRVLTQIECARQHRGAVLLVGERGVGREYLARVIHGQSLDANRAFVPLDCRLTSSAELKRVLKRLADDRTSLETLRPGTVFFRDVSAAPRDFQERLADWLTQRPSGEPPRVIASTDQTLSQLVEQDGFHRELYFLLTTLVIDLPPLRQRVDDVLMLAQHFLEEQNRGSDTQRGGFTDEAAEWLRRYHWPGNVAELRTVVASAVAHAENPLIGVGDFPLSFRSGRDAQRLGPPVSRFLPLERSLEQVERAEIERALAATRRNVSQTAELLGLTRAKLYRRIAALGIPWDEPAAS